MQVSAQVEVAHTACKNPRIDAAPWRRTGRCDSRYSPSEVEARSRLRGAGHHARAFITREDLEERSELAQLHPAKPHVRGERGAAQLRAGSRPGRWTPAAGETRAPRRAMPTPTGVSSSRATCSCSSFGAAAGRLRASTIAPMCSSSMRCRVPSRPRRFSPRKPSVSSRRMTSSEVQGSGGSRSDCCRWLAELEAREPLEPAGRHRPAAASASGARSTRRR